ncbi:MAG TPA: hypothetical protein VF069_27940 [Streptosporangiaceae bacterium]
MNNDDAPPPAALVAALAIERQFPGTKVWYGRATRRWWALLLIGGRGRLVEGASAEHLAHQIGSAHRWGRL